MPRPANLAGTLQQHQGGSCGLCGHFRELSRTHVPPQVAGNDRSVSRAPDRLVDGVRAPGRWTEGGLWVRGLCVSCNNLCGQHYDVAYADFAARVEQMTGESARRLLNGAVATGSPAVYFAPGLVSRCVMFGMFAINPRLRVLYPDLADDLRTLGHLDPTAIRWPDRLELRVGLFSRRDPPHALLSSGVWSMRVLGRRERHSSFGDVIFPPLMWCLVPTPEWRETSQLGPEVTRVLADASDWVHYRGTRTHVDLRNLTNKFTTMTHPGLGRNDAWVELMDVKGTAEDSVILYGRTR